VHWAWDWSTKAEPLTVTCTEALAQAVGAAKAVVAPTMAVAATLATTVASAATFLIELLNLL
jgi:hypothetical protein